MWRQGILTAGWLGRLAISTSSGIDWETLLQLLLWKNTEDVSWHQPRVCICTCNYLHMNPHMHVLTHMQKKPPMMYIHTYINTWKMEKKFGDRSEETHWRIEKKLRLIPKPLACASGWMVEPFLRCGNHRRNQVQWSSDPGWIRDSIFKLGYRSCGKEDHPKRESWVGRTSQAQKRRIKTKASMEIQLG